ncbi:NH(3)-dependent NAD(+) synthetase [Williamsoniiplasma lucivorax]|uniref:NH(3)-dependent NAD(+) synthetase n=2 Tax=Williamsoniiplasma lucivorax TaxID=209274 RepID=A0A2S5RD57_9MOLU|nr:NAD(+) synthase [Williamsoniiplasma lucivorax]PPE05227.1 NH(3)-dependent NAD(+) synthetase [Williamsoniiplasma lucivorax]
MKLEKYLDYLVEWIRQAVKEAHADGVIVGVSGGIDSAVVAHLAKKAFPNNYLTVWMPINSSHQDWACQEILVEQNQFKCVTVDLLKSFKQMSKVLKKTGVELSDLALSNTKARLRMSTLYALGQSKKYLVLGTDNLDEWHIGYFTKYGDGGVDLVPIIHLLKREVKQAAKIFGVPDVIIDRPPTAGLWENQTDEAEIGFSYDDIDAYLIGKNNNPDLKKRIDAMHLTSEHKRNLAAQPQEFLRDK